MKEIEYVPLEEADVLTSVCKRSTMTTIGLLGGRTVSVGLGTNKGIVVHIERPLPDGKRSFLGFALTSDTASALIELIMYNLRVSYESEILSKSEKE